MLNPTLARIIPLSLLQYFEYFILNNYDRSKKFLNRINPEFLEEISRKKALKIFKIAAKETPAYQKFLAKNKLNPKQIRSLADFDNLLPETDKANYIKKYSFEERCREGHLPKEGNIDESGGTSGKATNWVHAFQEEDLLFKAINFSFNYVFEGNKKDFLVISAWSVGPWATGIKFSEMMERISLVKNTATDPNDIIETLKIFGNKRNYLIAGYPPFVKNLIEEHPEVGWKRYNIDLVTGGEGVPIEWVYYMKRKLKEGAKIVSSFGCSDVDIGIGTETSFCFFIRELAYKNEKLRQELFGKEELPMVFQYNPLTHYIHPTKSPEGKEEFAITLLDSHAAVPKVKYNLHDEGKKLRFQEMIDTLTKYEPHFLKKFSASGYGKAEDIINLPFLCIFGRSDGTLSFDGANVFPDQIEGGILNNAKLEKITHRFKMERHFDHKHDVEFRVHVELKQGIKLDNKLKPKYQSSILKEILKLNPDYCESYSHNQKIIPIIYLYSFDHPLFKQDDRKVKNIYFMKNKNPGKKH